MGGVFDVCVCVDGEKRSKKNRKVEEEKDGWV